MHKRTSHKSRNLRGLWQWLVAFGFRLLYNELAWLYDPVSWVVSLGRWRDWQQTIWPYLPPGGRVLEVGFGPGHTLMDLARAGYQPLGLELSQAMLRQAQRRLRRQGLNVPLCRGRACTLPFTSQAFDAIILTFPTPFVYDPAWIHHVVRMLKVGGRVIIVETASFTKRTPLARCLEWLYRITGQRGPAPDLPAMLSMAGLEARRERVGIDGTLVSLVLADNRIADDSLS